METQEQTQVVPATDEEIEAWWQAFGRWLVLETGGDAPAEAKSMMNWRPGALIARIRQEQAEAERLRDALTEAPMVALGRTNTAFARWCMEQAQPTGQEVR